MVNLLFFAKLQIPLGRAQEWGKSSVYVVSKFDSKCRHFAQHKSLMPDQAVVVPPWRKGFFLSVPWICCKNDLV